MKRNIKILTTLVLSCGLFSNLTYALGVRALVAVPIAKHDWVFRLDDMHNFDNHMNMGMWAAMYGINETNSIFVMQGFMLHPDMDNRFGSLELLYRYTVFQNNFKEGTFRIAALGGGALKTNEGNQNAWTVGGVTTYYRDRIQLDLDALWMKGVHSPLEMKRFDASVQYRLTPTVFPEWGLSPMLNAVVEYNPRWMRGMPATHQGLLGLQYVTPQWMVTLGATPNFADPHDWGMLSSFQFRI